MKHFVITIVPLIQTFLSCYELMLLIRILSSWFSELEENRAIQFIAMCTDPYLNIFRKVIPPLGPIDFSPLFAFFTLELFETLLMRVLGL